MKYAYFEDGTIIECARRCCLKRHVKTYLYYNGGKVWFRDCAAWRSAVKEYFVKNPQFGGVK